MCDLCLIWWCWVTYTEKQLLILVFLSNPHNVTEDIHNCPIPWSSSDYQFQTSHSFILPPSPLNPVLKAKATRRDSGRLQWSVRDTLRRALYTHTGLSYLGRFLPTGWGRFLCLVYLCADRTAHWRRQETGLLLVSGRGVRAPE